MNPSIPGSCKGCGLPLLLENLYTDDGCPCNSRRGINFKPMPCSICRTDNCVKPGHRLPALFGEVAKWGSDGVGTQGDGHRVSRYDRKPVI